MEDKAPDIICFLAYRPVLGLRCITYTSFVVFKHNTLLTLFIIIIDSYRC